MIDKKRITKELEREAHAKRRARVRALGAELRAAKKRRAAAIKAAKDVCRARRIEAAARVKELRAAAKVATNRAADLERKTARTSCDVARSGAIAIGGEIAALRDRLAGADKDRRDYLAIDRRAKERRAPSSRRERQSESDDEIRQNIPPELVPLFERVKRQIKGSARMSRTEAFLHYAEEHPREVLAAVDDKTEEVVRELEKAQREARGAPLADFVYETAPEEEHAFSSMLNPRARRGALVVLGRLTRLAFDERGRGRVYSWSYPTAPLLAYDTKGRLHVVYAGKKIGRASDEARAEYARSHWGQEGRGDVHAGAELRGPFAKKERLGASTSITYTTKKGTDPKLVDYEHVWGEGRSVRRFVPPTVCRSRGLVALAGGTYRVTERGIVG